MLALVNCVTAFHKKRLLLRFPAGGDAAALQLFLGGRVRALRPCTQRSVLTLGRPALVFRPPLHMQSATRCRFQAGRVPLSPPRLLGDVLRSSEGNTELFTTFTWRVQLQVTFGASVKLSSFNTFLLSFSKCLVKRCHRSNIL